MARTILLLVCLTALLLPSRAVEAQRRIPAYRSRPVLSPYIGLFQGNNAGLNSYFAAVRPIQRMENFAQETDFEFAQQQQLINRRTTMMQQELETTLEDDGLLTQRPTSGTRRSARRPSGTFMNYSRFFPAGNTGIPLRSYGTFGSR